MDDIAIITEWKERNERINKEQRKRTIAFVVVCSLQVASTFILHIAYHIIDFATSLAIIFFLLSMFLFYNHIISFRIMHIIFDKFDKDE